MGRRGRDLYDNWCLPLKLSMQSVPITTNVVHSNPEQARCTQYNAIRGCRGRNRMVVGFTTTYAISAHHH